MAKTTSLVETLQNELKVKFDENMVGLAKLPFPILTELAKSLGITVSKRKYYNRPDFWHNGATITKENKELIIKWFRSAPVGGTLQYSGDITMDTPLYTKASDLYIMINNHMTERLLRSTSGRNKDFIDVMINFNYAVELAARTIKEAK